MAGFMTVIGPKRWTAQQTLRSARAKEGLRSGPSRGRFEEGSPQSLLTASQAQPPACFGLPSPFVPERDVSRSDPPFLPVPPFDVK